MAAHPETVLERLAAWYAAACDGDWEHRFGVSIQSTDNPGWWIKIDLAGTSLASRPFVKVAEGVGADDHPNAKRWLVCKVSDRVWHGAGDDTRLEEIVERFLAFAESSG